MVVGGEWVDRYTSSRIWNIMKFWPDPSPSHPPPGQTYLEGLDKFLYIQCSSSVLKLYITSYACSTE